MTRRRCREDVRWESVKDGHVVVPPFWEVRPELVCGTQGRQGVG